MKKDDINTLSKFAKKIVDKNVSVLAIFLLESTTNFINAWKIGFCFSFGQIFFIQKHTAFEKNLFHF